MGVGKYAHGHAAYKQSRQHSVANGGNNPSEYFFLIPLIFQEAYEEQATEQGYEDYAVDPKVVSEKEIAEVKIEIGAVAEVTVYLRKVSTIG